MTSARVPAAQLIAEFFDGRGFPAARCTFRPAFTQPEGSHVVQRLLAAECSSWVVGLMAGWVVGRPRRLVAARLGKTPWLVTVFEAYDWRSGIEATGEPSATKSRNQGTKILDGRRLTGRRASIVMKHGAARDTP